MKILRLFRIKRLFAYAYSKARRSNRRTRIYAGLIFAFVLLVGVLSAPFTFPEGATFAVPQGKSVRAVAATLKEEKLIRSKIVFEAMVYLRGGSIIAGEYSFQRKASVLSVGYRIATGDFRITPIRIKILEGATARQITDMLGEKIPGFDTILFYRLAKEKEGYLYPDTYFILPGAKPETVLGMLESTFEEQVSRPEVAAAIKRSGKTLSDIVIMASLLEKEVPATYDRQIIAGILWKRISIDMPLQIDAVFPYIIGKNSFELTRADLAIDSPYNTYVYKGLPAGPIANPSVDAILAAANPIQTNYLYYLSDKYSNLHYSATYDQHLVYKAKYLGS